MTLSARMDAHEAAAISPDGLEDALRDLHRIMPSDWHLAELTRSERTGDWTAIAVGRRGARLVGRPGLSMAEAVDELGIRLRHEFREEVIQRVV